MREIKFRGRVAPRGKQWFYGELDTHTWGVCILDKNTLHTVISETVGQYIGLKDATGKEIYEGDIVRFKLPPMVLTNEKTAVGAVVYEYGQFLVIIHAMRFTIFSVINDCTVIGNVHDNPELLEATE